MVQSIGLLAIRVMIGWVMVFHGAQKVFGAFEGQGMEAFIEQLTKLKFPQPMVLAYLAALAELLGGAFLILGLITRLAAVVVSATMFVAALVVHAGKFSGPGGMEFALTLAVVAAAIVFTGPGLYSADSIFRRLKPSSDA